MLLVYHYTTVISDDYFQKEFKESAIEKRSNMIM